MDILHGYGHVALTWTCCVAMGDSPAEPRTTEPRMGLLSEWTQHRMGLNPEMDSTLNGLNPKWTEPRMDSTLKGPNPEWTELRID